MRTRRVSTARRRPAARSRRVIRKLLDERAELREEVKQLNAAIHIYRELARRVPFCGAA